MIRWLIPTLVLLIGMAVCVGGLGYGVITVGVPTPDAPPAVAAKEQRDVNISSRLMIAGAGVALLGGAGLLVVGIHRVRHGPLRSDHQNQMAVE